MFYAFYLIKLIVFTAKNFNFLFVLYDKLDSVLEETLKGINLVCDSMVKRFFVYQVLEANNIASFFVIH